MAGLTRTQVVGQAVDPTWGNVADRLQRALKAAGYREYSYHMVPDGFVVVTRLEQIDRRGEALAEPMRWSADPPHVTLGDFSLSAYLQALSLAAAGRYRIIALVFAPESFAQHPKPPTQREAIDWLSGGLNRLPETLRSQPYHNAFAATALIYEFYRPRARETPPELLLPPASLSAERHLAGSRVAAGLTP